eukprot:GHVS01038474.1.p1 GENE.GHVS01038474.1~~GHVS01038474.1.p1  ORF type:complete len:285 (-),score=44.25 GHVS01038474.1:450-1265(-)
MSTAWLLLSWCPISSYCFFAVTHTMTFTGVPKNCRLHQRSLSFLLSILFLSCSFKNDTFCTSSSPARLLQPCYPSNFSGASSRPSSSHGNLVQPPIPLNSYYNFHCSAASRLYPPTRNAFNNGQPQQETTAGARRTPTIRQPARRGGANEAYAEALRAAGFRPVGHHHSPGLQTNAYLPTAAYPGVVVPGIGMSRSGQMCGRVGSRCLGSSSGSWQEGRSPPECCGGASTKCGVFSKVCCIRDGQKCEHNWQCCDEAYCQRLKGVCKGSNI